MAINPFSRPARQNIQQMRDYTPVNVIGSVLNKLDARQELGLAETDRIENFRREAMQRVLPQQRAEASALLADVDSKLNALAESGNYINAVPRIRTIGREIQDKLSVFNKDYETHQGTLSAIAKLREKGEVVSPASEYAFVNEPLQRRVSGETDRLTGPGVRANVDTFKLLSDFYGDMDDDQEMRYTDANGRTIIETFSGKDPEKILNSGLSILRSNPLIQEDIQREINFEKIQPGFSTRRAERVAQDLESIEDQIDLLEAQDENSPEIAQLKDRKELIQNNPEGYYDYQLRQEKMTNQVLPFMETAAEKYGVKLQNNPFDLADYKHQLARDLVDYKAKSEQRMIRGLSTAVETGSPIRWGGSYVDTITTLNGEIEDLQRGLSESADPIEHRSYQGAIDEKLMTLERINSRYSEVFQEVMDENGYDAAELMAAQQNKPQPPTDINSQDLAALRRTAVGTSRYIPSASGVMIEDPKWSKLTRDQKQYAENYKDWWRSTGSKQKEIDAAVEKKLKERDANRDKLQVPTLTLADGDNITTQMKQLLDGNPNELFQFYKETPEANPETVDPEEILEWDLNPKTITQYKAFNPRTGKPTYRLSILGKKRGSSKEVQVFTATPTSDELGAEWVEQLSGERALEGKWSDHFLSMQIGEEAPPIVGGEIAFGQGTTVKRNSQGDFVLNIPGQKAQHFGLYEIIEHLEAAEAAYYGSEE